MNEEDKECKKQSSDARWQKEAELLERISEMSDEEELPNPLRNRCDSVQDQHNLQPVVLSVQKRRKDGTEALSVVMVCTKCGYAREVWELMTASRFEDLVDLLPGSLS